MEKKTVLVKEAKEELKLEGMALIDEIRKEAQEEVKKEIKDKVKKELIKKEYDKIYREEMVKVEGEHNIFVPCDIMLGDKKFSGQCSVTAGEYDMIREILQRRDMEIHKQNSRSEFQSSATMHGPSGQVGGVSQMTRK